MDKIAEIAGKLTEAQREAVERAFASGNEIIQGGQDDSGLSTRVINNLIDKGLLKYKPIAGFHGTGWQLNETGLAVRNYLNGE